MIFLTKLIKKLFNDNLDKKIREDYKSSRYLLDEHSDLPEFYNEEMLLDLNVVNSPISNRFIYVYTTDGDLFLNRYKIGQTKKDPRVRVREQDSTSNSNDLILVDHWPAGTATDKKIHSLLEMNGYRRVRKNREWFEIENPSLVIPKMIHMAQNKNNIYID